MGKNFIDINNFTKTERKIFEQAAHSCPVHKSLSSNVKKVIHINIINA